MIMQEKLYLYVRLEAHITNIILIPPKFKVTLDL